MNYEDLWAVLYATGVFMLRLDGEVRWLSTADRAAFRRTLGGAAKLGSQLQLHPVPRASYSRVDVADSAVLWARSEATDETEALLSWEPKPTFIFRDGTTVKHTAIWALAGQLEPRLTERLNKRLAHDIGTAKKHASVANFMFAPPGALTETGKVVACLHSEPTYYSAKELVGKLIDAPDTKAIFKARQKAMAA